MDTSERRALRDHVIMLENKIVEERDCQLAVEFCEEAVDQLDNRRQQLCITISPSHDGIVDIAVGFTMWSGPPVDSVAAGVWYDIRDELGKFIVAYLRDKLVALCREQRKQDDILLCEIVGSSLPDDELEEDIRAPRGFRLNGSTSDEEEGA